MGPWTISESNARKEFLRAAWRIGVEVSSSIRAFSAEEEEEEEEKKEDQNLGVVSSGRGEEEEREW